MTYLLTSSPCLLGEEKLNDANSFTQLLRDHLPSPCRCLFISSTRHNHTFTEGHGYAIKRSFEANGFEFSDYTLLDGENENEAKALIDAADFIILAGGHVPTQLSFFEAIKLRELMRSFKGTLLGISAGSMNSADTVYIQPEEPGESRPDFLRFGKGLGITAQQILPHYNQVKDNYLDGRRLFEDITFADSFGKRFLVLPDGSFLYSREKGHEYVMGEAWIIQDAKMWKISSKDQKTEI